MRAIRVVALVGLLVADLGACGLVYEYDDLRARPTEASPSSASGSGGECAIASSSGAGGCDSPNLQEDPENCGACGRSCLGGNCNLGRCLPVLVGKSGTVAARELRIVGDWIYYLSNSCYGRVPKNAGATDEGTCLATETGVPGDSFFGKFALDETGAYFSLTTPSAVTALREGDQVPVQLLGARHLLVPHEIVVDSTSVFVNTQAGLVRVGKDNDVTDAGPVSVTPHYSGYALIADGEDLFYTANTSLEDAGYVGHVSKAGGMALQLTTGIQCARAVAWRDHIYTTNGLDIVRIAKTAIENLPEKISTSIEPVWGMTADCESIYWTAWNGSTSRGGIYKAPLSGGEAVELAGSETQPGESWWSSPVGIAVDDKAIYWAPDGGGIWRLAR